MPFQNVDTKTSIEGEPVKRVKTSTEEAVKRVKTSTGEEAVKRVIEEEAGETSTGEEGESAAKQVWTERIKSAENGAAQDDVSPPCLSTPLPASEQ